MIDTHCHLDQIDNPEAIVHRAESQGIQIIAVTNLPSHYALALGHLKNCRFVKPALGLHPLMVAANPQEMVPFIRLAKTADHIGEIGLDFSPKGISTKEAQLACFDKLLTSLQGRHRFITIHSRQAVPLILEMLHNKKVGPVVFHWFSGTGPELERVLSAGHYLSINPAMLSTESGKRVLEASPIERLLTETDAPYARIEKRAALPWDVGAVLKHLAALWKRDYNEVEKMIDANFARLTSAVV